MTGRHATRTFLAGLLVVAAVAGVALVGFAGSATADHDSPGNYTVVLPDSSDSQPGDQNGANASIWHLGSVNGSFEGTASPRGFEQVDYLVVEGRAIDFAECTTENTAAFGVDRGNDDAGTRTDDSLLNHRKDSKFRSEGILVEFFDEGDIAGEPTHMNRTDQIVAVQRDCYRMPEEPGWYQISSSLNGTGYDGTFFEIEMDSHYFYICECDGEAEAREQLGPPPSEEDAGRDDGGEGGGPAETATPTTTASDDTDDDRDPTPTPQQATPSPTPEPAENDQQADEQEGQDDGDQQSRDRGSDGDQQRDQQRTDEQSRATEVVHRTATAVPTTPTIADGPGFGPGLALVALLGAALLAARR